MLNGEGLPMLRGRYGLGWMVVGWLAIAAAMALALWIVGVLTPMTVPPAP
jgi:hypothetical protein